jgi:hypothetical protein
MAWDYMVKQAAASNLWMKITLCSGRYRGTDIYQRRKLLSASNKYLIALYQQNIKN